MADPHGTGAPTGTDQGGADRTGTWLVRIAVAAGVAWTAYAEYTLARFIGAHWTISAALPVALDIYVIAAIRRGWKRDLFGALAIMGVAQVAAHLLEAKQIEVSVPLVTAVAMLVPLSIWRAHALAKPVPAKVPEPQPAAEPAKPSLAAVPAPRMAAVPTASRRPAARASVRTGTRKVSVKPEHVTAARGWLAEDPKLSGTAIGKRLGGKGDSYGRRVKRVAAGGQP